MSLLAACLFEESDAGGKSESPQPYPDRVQNKWTDPVPDGIERAEPTLAPSRRRLTFELARSRIHNMEPNLKKGPTLATRDETAFTFPLEACQVIYDIFQRS